MRPASHRGGKRRREQPAAAVCAYARTRGVAPRPVSQAPATLYNASRGSMGVPAHLHPPSRCGTAAAASGGGAQRQPAAGSDGSWPARLSDANGCSDADVEASEVGTLPTDRLPASTCLCPSASGESSRLTSTASLSASRVLLWRPSCLMPACAHEHGSGARLQRQQGSRKF
jgi:hypothetical protein